jgi:hypothetical protein
MKQALLITACAVGLPSALFAQTLYNFDGTSGMFIGYGDSDGFKSAGVSGSVSVETGPPTHIVGAVDASGANGFWYAFLQNANVGQLGDVDPMNLSVSISYTASEAGRTPNLQMFNNDHPDNGKSGKTFSLPAVASAGEFQTAEFDFADGSDIGGGIFEPNPTYGSSNDVWFQINFQGGWSDPANAQVWVDDITVVPEPSAYAALAGVLVFGLAVWTRRRRR